MSTLRLALDLALPVETVTQTVAILAKRRAGKSYLARRVVEQLHHARQQVVIVDPKGDWWGIRSAADGKQPGLPIVILGGERGDVPLEVQAGEVVARLCVVERVSALLDLSLLRKKEVAVFMAAFLEHLYRLKARETYRTPMMLVIDEADAIAPQRPMPGEERMLGAAEDIVRRGGQRGIGCTVITQRSAVLNKNVLTQAQVLIALRTIAPQDLAALKAWVDVHGTPEELRTLMASVPSLPTGDAWVWSPGWPTDRGIFGRHHVLPIETFDSGATPKPGEVRREPKQLADVDLDGLRRQMAATIEQAKANDPAELRKKIAGLERELAAARRAPTVETIEVPVLKPDAVAALEALVGRIDQVATPLIAAANDITHALRAVRDRGPVAPPPPRAQPRVPAPVRPPVAARTDGPLEPGMQRILDTVAMLDIRGITKDTEVVARWMGIHPNGGRYRTQLGALRAQGYLASWELTDQGRALARAGATGLEGALAGLDDGQRRIVETVVDSPAESTEALAERLGLHPNGGRFRTNLGRVRTLGIVTPRAPIAPTEALFR